MRLNVKNLLRFFLVLIPVGLVENAFFGWAQMELGITNEVIGRAVRWGIQFGVPAFTVAVGFYFYYKVVDRFGPKQHTKKEAEHTPETQHAETDVEDATLKSLSNTALRRRATTLAAEMRAFEVNYKATESIRMQEQSSRSAMRSKDMTEEQKSAAWYEDRLRDSGYRAQFRAAFMTRYYQKAVAMRHELSGRLGIFPPYREMSATLDHGMLAGVNPVTEAADLLDSLAAKLP